MSERSGRFGRCVGNGGTNRDGSVERSSFGIGSNCDIEVRYSTVTGLTMSGFTLMHGECRGESDVLWAAWLDQWD